MNDNFKSKLYQALTAHWSQVKETVLSMDEIKEWDTLVEWFENAERIVKLLEHFTATVQKVADLFERETGEFIKSKEKQKALINYLDKKIPLPFYLEWVDNVVLAGLIDYVVKSLKQRYQDDWVDMALAA